MPARRKDPMLDAVTFRATTSCTETHRRYSWCETLILLLFARGVVDNCGVLANSCRRQQRGTLTWLLSSLSMKPFRSRLEVATILMVSWRTRNLERRRTEHRARLFTHAESEITAARGEASKQGVICPRKIIEYEYVRLHTSLPV